MADPQTKLHYTANGNFTGTNYDPGAFGFNLADVSSVSLLNALPSGDLGLVWLGATGGATASFQSTVNQYIGNGKVYGFYLADEPGPDVSAANLKAESDYIHSVMPGAKTFIVLENNSSPENPSYSFNPANTDIDLFGLDPYPIRPDFTGGADYSVIGDAVAAAEAEGVPQSAIVPVYQAFGGGGYSSWTLPTAAQEQTILSTWGQYTPTPAFDEAYSWGVQDGDTALSDTPSLQQVFAAHNGVSSSTPATTPTPTPAPTPTPTPAPTPTPTPAPTPTPTPTGTTLTVTDSQGSTGSVPMISTGSSRTAAGAGVVKQNVASGVDTVSFTSITAETLQLGSSTVNMSFVSPRNLTVTGGSGTATISVSSGTNSFTAGTGSMTVTAGSGHDSFIYHQGDGLLTIDSFSKRNDTLTVDKSLQASFTETSDGHGGLMLNFGSAAKGIDLAGITSMPASTIHFV